MKKSKSILSLLLTVILIVGLGFTVIAGIGKSKTGEMCIRDRSGSDNDSCTAALPDIRTAYERVPGAD